LKPTPSLATVIRELEELIRLPVRQMPVSPRAVAVTVPRDGTPVDVQFA